jgi:hypothetical protein
MNKNEKIVEMRREMRLMLESVEAAMVVGGTLNNTGADQGAGPGEFCSNWIPAGGNRNLLR